MFRAEILWMANGPTLKMEGRLVGEWAEQARFLVTTDVAAEGVDRRSDRGELCRFSRRAFAELVG